MTPFQEHCLRVSALAAEIGRRAGLSEMEQSCLKEAGLIHHDTYMGTATGRLAAWLNHPSAAPLSNEVVRALRIFHGQDSAADPEARNLAEALRVADAFDEMLEFRRFEARPVAELLTEIAELESTLGGTGVAATALSDLCRDRRNEILAAAGRLPVSAIAVLRNLVRVPSNQVTVTALKAAAESDAVLAADLLRAVNSPVQSPHQRLSSLVQAIQYLGTAAAREVLIAGAMRILCASSAVRSLWQHSLRVAADSQSLAERLDLDPSEAYLAGLLHDIGRLAMQCLHGETAETYQRLREREVPSVWAEWVAFEYDHAEIGATLMENWGASRALIDGIRLHHQPEAGDSHLASILYLAETRNDDRESMPAPDRVIGALADCGLTGDELTSRQSQRIAI
jgi:putative nucleotidyltransferase with HDIG domain